MIRQSLSSKTSVKRRDTMSSGLIRKRISSWTRPELVTPPPTNLLAKSTCDCRKRPQTQTLIHILTKQNFSLWGIGGGGLDWKLLSHSFHTGKRIPEVLFGKAAWGGGITQAPVPPVTASSLEARHFTLMLPVANIKTRAELMSLSSHNMLVNWPMTDPPWYPVQRYKDGRSRLVCFFNIIIFLSTSNSEKQGVKKNPHISSI